MQIVLLATGENEHLPPLTRRLPSPLLPIVDRPVMVYLLEMLARQNVDQMLVSLWNQAGAIEAYFGSGRRWGLDLEYVLQPDPLGSAGTAKWLERLLAGTFLLLPADQLFSLDLQSLLAAHRVQKNVVTLVEHPDAPARPFSVGGDGHVQTTQPSYRPLVPTGAAILEPAVLAHIPRHQSFDLIADLVPTLLASGVSVGTYQLSGYWNPLATFEGYRQAQWDTLCNADLEAGEPADAGLLRHLGLPATQIADGIWVGRRNAIHPSVRLSPPVYVGDDCALGRNVELGPGAIIGSSSVVADGATVSDSVILDHTYVGELVHLENRLVTGRHMVDVKTGENVALVDDFLLSDARPEIVTGSARRSLERLLALLLLVLLLPLFVLVGALVFLFTGHLFVRQPRVVPRRALAESSTGEETIPLLRFYTRRPVGTFIGAGRWLEAWELHRLPELWNVVRGDLALIGLKPLAPAQRKQMDGFWEETRHGQPAGFTGLWYVQTTQDADLDEVLATDAYYAATRTWQEDLCLLYKTPAGWRQRQHSRNQSRL